MGTLARELASLVAPPHCAACHRAACDRGSPLCVRCRSELEAAAAVIEPGPPGIELAVAASGFDGVARQLAHGLKYGRRLELAEVCAQAMIRACREQELAGGVVPVPAAPWRWRWRGFDPAEEIALALARLSGLPYGPCLRRRHGPRQVGRRRSDRLRNPPVVTVVGDVPREALLVDDVHTTGATLSACARALRAAGCRDVVALTLARAT